MGFFFEDNKKKAGEGWKDEFESFVGKQGRFGNKPLVWGKGKGGGGATFDICCSLKSSLFHIATTMASLPRRKNPQPASTNALGPKSKHLIGVALV